MDTPGLLLFPRRVRCHWFQFAGLGVAGFAGSSMDVHISDGCGSHFSSHWNRCVNAGTPRSKPSLTHSSVSDTNVRPWTPPPSFIEEDIFLDIRYHIHIRFRDDDEWRRGNAIGGGKPMPTRTSNCADAGTEAMLTTAISTAPRIDFFMNGFPL
jgi:hypothetical protein